MIFYQQLTQGTDEWLKLRKGKVTASNAEKILTSGGKKSAQWESFAIELVTECICPDEPPAWNGNKHTERGTNTEPEARQRFMTETGCDVQEVGFIGRGIDDPVGLSPDGLVYDALEWTHGLELKCPMAKVHAGYFLAGKLPDAYRPQVHFSMAVTGRPWWFMSYCRNMKPFIIEVEPDAYTRSMAGAIDDFVGYYQSRYAAICELLTDTKP